jgi:photosystem II stability/assembly factor-like uncharacterized protein
MLRFRSILLPLLILLSHTNLQAQDWVTLMDNGAPFPVVKEAFEAYFKDKPYEKGKGWKQFKRWEYFMQNRIDSSGYLPYALMNQSMADLTLNPPASSSESTGDAWWVPRGPFAVPQNGYGAGRLNAVAFHPVNPNILWVGSPSGGLWKSTDGGSSWTTTTDQLSVIGISDILINPNNPDIMYIGTGDPNGTDTYSLGVLKSTDGGATWNQTGLTWLVNNGRQVFKLLMMPGNDNVLLAATSNGIFKSTDAGQTWTMNRSGSYRDMEFKPGNPNVIYAVTTSRMFVSTDNGNSFSLSNSFTPVATTSRLSLAVTPDDSNYIYILAAKASDNGFEGLYLSTDGGQSFLNRSSTPNILGWQVNGSDAGGQGWYDLSLAVSPNNKSTVFVGGINIWRSVNAGSGWTLSAHWTGSGGKPLVHADIHELEFTASGDRIYACSDGGLSVSSNTGVSWTDLHANLSIGQIYRIGVSQTTPGLVMSGWQDNGSNLRRQNNTWVKALGGDGMECIIDHQNSNYMYGSLYYGDLRRSADGGANWTDISNSITEDASWVAPFVMDPNNPAILFAGYNNLWKSSNRGNTWTKLTNFTGTATLDCIAIAPSNTQYIYISTQTVIYRSSNGGLSWINITTGLPSGNISDIVVSSHNPNHVFVTKTGYYSGNKVFRSRDGGATWQNYSGSLPNLPANTIAYENGKRDALYVGMDVGVYYRDSLMADWLPYSLNLPNVIISELEIQYSDHKLVAATYGRGVWQTDTWDWINTVQENPIEHNVLKVYPNPASSSIQLSLGTPLYSSVRINLRDISGRIVLSENLPEMTENHVLDVSNISQGIYIIEVQSIGGSLCRRIVISH